MMKKRITPYVLIIISFLLIGLIFIPFIVSRYTLIGHPENNPDETTFLHVTEFGSIFTRIMNVTETTGIVMIGTCIGILAAAIFAFIAYIRAKAEWTRTLGKVVFSLGTVAFLFCLVFALANFPTM